MTGEKSPQSDNVKDANFRFLHANADGYITRSALITAEISLLEKKPQIVMLNETKTDKADPMAPEGYLLLYRKDRLKGGGGIAIFARFDISLRCSVIEESEDERCWILIHSGLGPILGCCWYRPPVQGESASMDRFKHEHDKRLNGQTWAMGLSMIVKPCR